MNFIYLLLILCLQSFAQPDFTRPGTPAYPTTRISGSQSPTTDTPTYSPRSAEEEITSLPFGIEISNTPALARHNLWPAIRQVEQYCQEIEKIMRWNSTCSILQDLQTKIEKYSAKQPIQIFLRFLIELNQHEAAQISVRAKELQKNYETSEHALDGGLGAAENFLMIRHVISALEIDAKNAITIYKAKVVTLTALFVIMVGCLTVALPKILG